MTERGAIVDRELEELEDDFQRQYSCVICKRLEGAEIALSVCKNVLNNLLSFKDAVGKIWIYCHCRRIYHLDCLINIPQSAWAPAVCNLDPFENTTEH